MLPNNFQAKTPNQQQDRMETHPATLTDRGTRKMKFLSSGPVAANGPKTCDTAAKNAADPGIPLPTPPA